MESSETLTIPAWQNLGSLSVEEVCSFHEFSGTRKTSSGKQGSAQPWKRRNSFHSLSRKDTASPGHSGHGRGDTAYQN